MAIGIREAPASRDIRNLEAQGLRVGTLVRVDSSGVPHVEYPGNSSGPVPARSIVPVAAPDAVSSGAGASVVLLFSKDEPSRPIILGFLQDAPGRSHRQPADSRVEDPDVMLKRGRRIVLEASQEIVLRCGKGSVTLSADGKVVVRGAKVLSRASGVNAIRGAAVRIN